MNRTIITIGVLILVVGGLFLLLRKPSNSLISQFGQYQGYSEAVYDGSERHSAYLTLDDGTRLAYDLFLPTKDDVPSAEPLPVLFKYTPYLRTMTIFDEHGNNIFANLYDLKGYEKLMLRIRYMVYDQGHLMDLLFRTTWLKRMLEHGYAVIVVERSGTGASFGVMDPSFEAAASEADQILNWIADQPWSDGNIGMFGESFEAMVQFAAATTGNPHLKALFPASSSMDNYSAVVYRGGVYNEAFGSFFSWSTSFLETVVTPVDQDQDGTLLAQARQERSGSTMGEESAVVFDQYPYHDSTNADGVNIWEGVFAIYPLLDQINQAAIPIYMTSGWYDLFTADMIFWYANLAGPRRLIIRPLDHSQLSDDQFDLDYGLEAHRWFDYWLKGIENGIMEEPPIHYYVMGEAEKEAWHTSDQWPLATQEPTRFYFASGRTGSVNSTNDGFLSQEPPTEARGVDNYTIDYTTSSGQHSRWYAVNWERDYPDMQANDEKGLTYTTPPLENDTQITGHPVVNLWLTTDVPDLDMFVYLEAVDSRGRSTYITEGTLRASHRSLDDPFFDNLGLPFHRYYESSQASIPPGEPILLAFDLLPTAYLFQKGDRIRVTITGADAHNFDTPALDPAPEMRLLRSSDLASSIDLPIVPRMP